MLFKRHRIQKSRKQIKKEFNKLKKEFDKFDTYKKIFTIYYPEYATSTMFQIEKMVIDYANTQERSIKIFKLAHPEQYEEMKLCQYAFEFSPEYLATDSDKKICHYSNRHYFDELKLKEIEQIRILKLKQSIIDKNSSPDFQPLYYRKNGVYYETELYTDPSKLHNLIPALPEETD